MTSQVQIFKKFQNARNLDDANNDDGHVDDDNNKNNFTKSKIAKIPAVKCLFLFNILYNTLLY